MLSVPERGAVEEALGFGDWAEPSLEVVLETAGGSGPVLLHCHHHTCSCSYSKNSKNKSKGVIDRYKDCTGRYHVRSIIQ